MQIGEFTQALEAVAQLQALGETSGDPRLQCSAAGISGWIHATMGDWAAAIEACRRSIAHAPSSMDSALALGFLGYAYVEQGDTAQAIPVLAQAVQLSGNVGYQQVHGWFTTFLGQAYLLDGHLEKARELALQGLTITRESKFWWGVGDAQRVLGRIAMATGAVSEAAMYLQEALQTFGAIPARFEVGRTHLALAELAHAQGNREALGAHLDEARALFRALQVPKYIARTESLAEQWQASLGAAAAG